MHDTADETSIIDNLDGNTLQVGIQGVAETMEAHRGWSSAFVGGEPID